MRVKICGITKPEQGRAIAQMGASALGFICVSRSPRHVTPLQIRAVVSRLQGESVGCIGVFANSTPETICQVFREAGGLTGVQLHGDESPEVCDRLRRLLPPGIELIKALRVKTSAALETAKEYVDCVDTLLLDAYHPGMLGGTGKQLDWGSLTAFDPGCPWLLAGGLTPDNVLAALAQVNPAGIDLSSGVERSPGDKDLAKVARLFEMLKRQEV
jgi:phosphoribosylanthranilate isomerase